MAIPIRAIRIRRRTAPLTALAAARERKSKRPVVYEADILRQCLEFLRLVKIPAWRQNSGSMRAGEGKAKRYVRFNGADGCSDVIGLLPGSGRLLAVETKRPGGKLTARQAGFLKAVRDAGGIALLVHSVEELRQGLREAGYDC